MKSALLSSKPILWRSFTIKQKSSGQHLPKRSIQLWLLPLNEQVKKMQGRRNNNLATVTTVILKQTMSGKNICCINMPHFSTHNPIKIKNRQDCTWGHPHHVQTCKFTVILEGAHKWLFFMLHVLQWEHLCVNTQYGSVSA